MSGRASRTGLAAVVLGLSAVAGPGIDAALPPAPAPPAPQATQGRGATRQPGPVPFSRAAVSVGAVVGEVVDAASGRGVAGAVVTITSASGTATDRRRADARGRYYFKGLEPGDYAISAERPGYLTGAYGRLRPDGEALTIFVGAGQVAGVARVDLWRPGSVSGIVTDESNDPIVGVRVLAHRVTFEHGERRLANAGETTTDDRGMFRVSGLVPGDHLVSVPQQKIGMAMSAMEAIATTGNSRAEHTWLLAAAGGLRAPGQGPGAREMSERVLFDPDNDRIDFAVGYIDAPSAATGARTTYSTLFYPGLDDSSFAATVPVEAARDFAGVTFQMRPVAAGAVTGVVVGPDGPVDGLLLRLLRDTETQVEPGFETALTVTTAAGEFSFGDVPRGSYVIEGRSARSLSFSTPNATSVPNRPVLAVRDALWVRHPVTISGEPSDPIVVLASEGERVSGTLIFEGRGTPPADAAGRIEVELAPVNAGGPKPPRGVLDPSGGFAMAGVAPGRYLVRVSGAPAGWHVASIVSAGRDLTAEAFVVGDAASAATGIAIRLSNVLPRVTGIVRDATGRATSAATVVVFPARMTDGTRTNALRFRSARASEVGYVVDGLPPGTYNVAAIHESEAGQWQEPGRLEEIRARATVVTVRAQDYQVVNLRLPGRRE